MNPSTSLTMTTDSEMALREALRRVSPETARRLFEEHQDEAFGVPHRSGPIAAEIILSVATPVVVYHDEVGGFWGEVPRLSGCVSQGESLAETLVNLAEAATAYLAADDPGASSRLPTDWDDEGSGDRLRP